MSVGNSMWGNSIPLLGRSLDYLWAKQKLASNNIANAETPGYKAKYITFEENYEKRIKAATKAGVNQVGGIIRSSHYEIEENTDESARLDGNNVNTEVQMTELTRTALQYQYGIESINSDFSRLRAAIKGQ